jgi:dihydroorotase
MNVMQDPSVSLMPTDDGAHRPATSTQIEEMVRLTEHGLRRGALAVGMGLQYTPAASAWEALEIFRAAARRGASVHVHIRNAGEKRPDSVEALQEVIADAAVTSAPLHVVHVSSMGLRATPHLLAMIENARSHGLDVTTECYPYGAGMTYIESATFASGWQEVFGINYGDLQWAATGERLTAETFARYRKQGGLVALHTMPEEIVRQTVAHPLTIIASDGILTNGKGHPRAAGTYSRVLGRYVRESGVMGLMEALRKMTLMPAARLEKRVPTMRAKGRVREGADADLTIFDPNTIIDQATYEEPTRPPRGIGYVVVNGVIVVKQGKLDPAVIPGKPVRAPLQ